MSKHEPEAKIETWSWREQGCNQCNKHFGKYEPFFHHETDGSCSGGACIKCAIEMGLGNPDPNGNWVFHPGDEP